MAAQESVPAFAPIGWGKGVAVGKMGKTPTDRDLAGRPRIYRALGVGRYGFGL